MRWVESACVCPACRGDLLSAPESIECLSCGQSYAVWNHIPLLLKDVNGHLQKLQKLSSSSPKWYCNDQSKCAQTGAYRRHLNRRKNYVETVLSNILGGMDMANNATFLDFGCGDGHNLEWIARPGVELYATDYNIERAARASQKGPFKIFLSDIGEPCVRDGYFNVIFLNHVIEHIREDEKALCSLWSMLSKKGHLILGTPNEGARWWQLAFDMEPDVIRKTDHVHFYTGEEICHKCKNAGFTVMELKYMGYGIPHFTADAILKDVMDYADDIFEKLGQQYFRDQATSMYVILKKE